jgi:hypothetical protein
MVEVSLGWLGDTGDRGSIGWGAVVGSVGRGVKGSRGVMVGVGVESISRGGVSSPLGSVLDAGGGVVLSPNRLSRVSATLPIKSSKKVMAV